MDLCRLWNQLRSCKCYSGQIFLKTAPPPPPRLQTPAPSTWTSCADPVSSPAEDFLPVFWLYPSFGCWIRTIQRNVCHVSSFFSSQESFHVASLLPAPWSSLLFFPWHVSWQVSLCGCRRCQHVKDGASELNEPSTSRKKTLKCSDLSVFIMAETRQKLK